MRRKVFKGMRQQLFSTIIDRSFCWWIKIKLFKTYFRYLLDKHTADCTSSLQQKRLHSYIMTLTSELQLLEGQRNQLLIHEETLIAAHNDQLTKLRSHLGTLDDKIFHLKQSLNQLAHTTKSSKKPKESKSDTWKCLCGNMLTVDRKRCGKCLRWRGGKRGSNPPIIQRVVSSNDNEVEPPKRKRRRKSSKDKSSAVSIDDEQAAASLISLSLSL